MSRFWQNVLVAAVLAVATSACGSNMTIQVGDDGGVPLAELDQTGAAPTRLVLASPDRVVITEGSALAIAISGDPAAVEALRFDLEDGRLGIMRDKDSRASGRATIAVTMPPVREIVLAGSGDVQAPALVDEAEVTIAGSGTVAVARVAARSLEVNVMGSGTLNAAGETQELDFKVAGSGKLAARELKVARADVNIAGSGGGAFASDGTVDANIAGSGQVTVYGRADCRISAVGSGRLRCVGADSPPTPLAPAVPAAPQAEPAPPAPDAPPPAQ